MSGICPCPGSVSQPNPVQALPNNLKHCWKAGTGYRSGYTSPSCRQTLHMPSPQPTGLRSHIVQIVINLFFIPFGILESHGDLLLWTSNICIRCCVHYVTQRLRELQPCFIKWLHFGKHITAVIFILLVRMLEITS